MSWSDALWDCFLPVFPSGCPPRMWHCNWHGAGALHPGGVGVRHQPLLLRVHTERSEVQLPQEVCTCSPHLILASAFRLFVNVLFSHCISPLHFIDVFLCFISQEKIPISLTPFLTRKIHNLSLCCLFLSASCLLSAPLTKRGGSVAASTQHSPSIIFSLLLSAPEDGVLTERQLENMIDSLTGNSAWTNRNNSLSNR